MKKTTRSIVSLLLLLSVLVIGIGTAQATQVQPRYTGVAMITSSLNISATGGAVCDGSATVRSGYKANLTVELKRDGTTIKTWTASGTGLIDAGGTYYVTSGHTYVVTTTVTVYDSNGRFVESPSVDSRESDY